MNIVKQGKKIPCHLQARKVEGEQRKTKYPALASKARGVKKNNNIDLHERRGRGKEIYTKD